MNSFAIDRIVFVRYGCDPPGSEWHNYKNGRGVCGLVAVLDGCAEYEFSDGRKKKLSKGDIAIFSDKTAYVMRYAGDRNFLHYTVNFTLSEKHSLPADETYLGVSDISGLASKCQAILNEISKGHPASVLSAMSYLYSALSEVYSNEQVELSDRKEYTSILPAIRLIESGYKSKLDADTLAKACLMSVTNFRRTFGKVFAVSPAEYIIRLRMSRAKALLKHTDLSVKEIAVECGYADTEHFCRTFKARHGLTAIKYRREM